MEKGEIGTSLRRKIKQVQSYRQINFDLVPIKRNIITNDQGICKKKKENQDE